MILLWRRLDHPGYEWCRVEETSTGRVFEGLVLVSFRRKPHRIEYDIQTDSDWQTKTVSIRSDGVGGSVSLDPRVDSKNRWFRNGKIVESVEGCVDVDLGFSPSTNALPINRLKLKRGKRVDVVAAWVEFPSFHLKPLQQAYERVDRRIVHYESAGGMFRRELEVNQQGFVVQYPDFWELEVSRRS